MKAIKEDTNRWKDILWKNRYFKNDHTIQGNLHIQCNPHQITSGIFHRTRTKDFYFCIETQKNLKYQSHLEKKT